MRKLGPTFKFLQALILHRTATTKKPRENFQTLAYLKSKPHLDVLIGSYYSSSNYYGSS